MNKQTITAIIPAAGCGTRTGLNANKILTSIADRSVLSWTLNTLAASKVLLAEINLDLSVCIIAAQRQEFATIRATQDFGKLPFAVQLVEGGTTRQESVHNAVKAADSDWVMIHDAARPLASPQLFASVAKTAQMYGAAIAALPACDTVKIADECTDKSTFPTTIKSTFDRHRIWLAQTPQIFRHTAFLEAHQSAKQDNFIGTDGASLMERMGHKVALVTGETQNFKITYKEDLQRAEQYLRHLHY